MKYDCFGLVPHPATGFEGMFPEAPKLRDYGLEFTLRREAVKMKPYSGTSLNLL